MVHGRRVDPRPGGRNRVCAGTQCDVEKVPHSRIVKERIRKPIGIVDDIEILGVNVIIATPEQAALSGGPLRRNQIVTTSDLVRLLSGTPPI